MSLPYSPLLRSVFGVGFFRVAATARKGACFFAAAPARAAGVGAAGADCRPYELEAPSGRVGIDDAERRRLAASTSLGALGFVGEASPETRKVSPRVLSFQARGLELVAFAGFGFPETPLDGRFATTGAP
jgi:hypothetical protein